MSATSLRLPKFSINIINSSSLNVTNSLSVTNGTNQLFDWVVINKPCVYSGEAYYRSGSGDYELSSTATDETAEVIGIVEQVTPCANSSSLAKIVYYGKLTFDSSSLVLQDGSPYFLATSSINSYYNTGPNLIRNLTINEPLISKPLFIAVSNFEAVMVNYRGHVNNPTWTASLFTPPSEYDCACLDVEPVPDIVSPTIQVHIGVIPPTF
jgi:hypothetical protein